MAKILSGERLNFIIAFCAILVSAASFYATYLQANSSEQQVKAMTWPLIEFSHGNYNSDTREANLSLTLGNAGVGPAIVKNVNFRYQDRTLHSLNEFIEACCSEALASYMVHVRANKLGSDDWTMTTSPLAGTILPVGGQVDFLLLPRHDKNDDLWVRINKERFSLNLEVCYCSLLENCYITDRPGQVQEVQSCPGLGI